MTESETRIDPIFIEHCVFDDSGQGFWVVRLFRGRLRDRALLERFLHLSENFSIRFARMADTARFQRLNILGETSISPEPLETSCSILPPVLPKKAPLSRRR